MLSTSTSIVTLFCLALVGGVFQRAIPSCNAFSLTGTGSAAHQLSIQQPVVPRATTSTLHMSEEAEASEGDAEGDAESAVDDSDSTEEEEGPPEDPEVTALKESIAELEATLKDKKSKIQYELDRCEEYSKSGYARKVADMENMKRVRSNIASTTKASATAAVLKDFLPIYDTLNNLRGMFSEDEFGKKYSELNLQQTFTNLGVTDFDVEAGQAINNFRMKVLESEVSAEHPKDTVLRQVAPGLELDGNVIRAAMCVSSVGAEEETEESSEGEEGATE